MAEKGIEIAREIKQMKKEGELEDKRRAEKAAEAKPEIKAKPATAKPEPAAAKPDAKPAAKAEPAKKEEPKKGEKKKEEEVVLEEKVLTIALRDAWKAPRTKRTSAAIKILKKQLERHLKKPVVLDVSLNRSMWQRGIQKPPRKIKVKARIMKDKAKAYPVEKA